MAGERGRVVVTGASSGIGRATAEAFAARGHDLVLAARSGERLEEVAAECRRRGVEVVTVAADVGIGADVERLAEAAIAAGGFDVWVNNAGVTAFGRIEDTPPEDHERILRTNLLGCLLGARAAVRHFRERGRGTLIDVSSVVGRSVQPYSSAYTASKWGIRGLDHAIRSEIADTPGIHVCTVMPTFIDTPVFENAANYTGHLQRPVDPVYPPEDVAARIVELVDSPRDETVVGDAGRVITAAHGVAPGLVDRVSRFPLEARQFMDEPAAAGSGNLYEPRGRTTTTAGWQERSLRGRTADRTMRAVAVAAVVVLAATLLSRFGVRRV